MNVADGRPTHGHLPAGRQVRGLWTRGLGSRFGEALRGISGMASARKFFSECRKGNVRTPINPHIVKIWPDSGLTIFEGPLFCETRTLSHIHFWGARETYVAGHTIADCGIRTAELGNGEFRGSHWLLAVTDPRTLNADVQNPRTGSTL